MNWFFAGDCWFWSHRAPCWAKIVRPTNVALGKTHQALEFEWNYEDVAITSPREEVKAYVLQNDQWQKMIGPLDPGLIRANALVWDSRHQLIFPAGKEYRQFDIRTLGFGNKEVDDIYVRGQTVTVDLIPDIPRRYKIYFDDPDFNGQYVIMDQDDLARLGQNRSIAESQYRSEYCKVNFFLESKSDLEDKEIYITGALTNWDCREENKMTYNSETGMFEGSLYLKQGVYDYKYVVKNGDKIGDGSTIDGNWYESDNNYSILLYYRPFAARYDRLIGFTGLSNRI